MPPGDPARELGDQFMAVTDALRRVLIRAARSTAALPTLTEAHATLLRKLVADGPCTPAQASAELHLARSTISNLVRELIANGMIERVTSTTDKRSVSLFPTQRARDVLDAFSRGRSLVLAQAVASLPGKDRAQLAAALPVLESVLAAIVATSGVSDPSDTR
jgi:DNA-binding MarR family transcriptional regulator